MFLTFYITGNLPAPWHGVYYLELLVLKPCQPIVRVHLGVWCWGWASKMGPMFLKLGLRVKRPRSLVSKGEMLTDVGRERSWPCCLEIRVSPTGAPVELFKRPVQPCGNVA